MNELFSVIYSLYPRNLKYNSSEYINSPQHLNFQQTIISNDILKQQKEFYNHVKNIFHDYYVNDFTSNDYWSFEFIVLLNKIENILDDDVELLKKLGGVRKDIFIYISKISKYYCYTFSVTRLVEKSLDFKYQDLTHTIKMELSELNDFMKSQGYSLLNAREISQVIPDIETELTEMGKAKVFDLLFTDLYSHAPYEEYD